MVDITEEPQLQNRLLFWTLGPSRGCVEIFICWWRSQLPLPSEQGRLLWFSPSHLQIGHQRALTMSSCVTSGGISQEQSRGGESLPLTRWPCSWMKKAALFYWLRIILLFNDCVCVKNMCSLKVNHCNIPRVTLPILQCMKQSVYNTKCWPLGIIMEISSVKTTELTFSSHNSTRQSPNVLIAVNLFAIFAKGINPST